MRRFLSLVALVAALLASPHAHARTPLARGVGKAIGFSAGVALTGALALSRKWNQPLRDAEGRVEQIRVGGHAFTLRQRHRPVVGPKLLARAEKMKGRTSLQRLRKHFVLGLGQGATAAPPAEARAEAWITSAW